MAAATVHFLLVYSHKEQRLVHQEEFRDSAKATTAYAEAEQRHIKDDAYEIVLIGSDSIQTIMKTHGHYFASEKMPIFGELALAI